MGTGDFVRDEYIGFPLLNKLLASNFRQIGNSFDRTAIVSPSSLLVFTPSR